MLAADVEQIRGVIAEFPALDAHTAGQIIDPGEIYFPRSHVAALDPNRSLVVGNRGMGKSFWADALVQRDARQRIAEVSDKRAFRGALEVTFGFANAEGNYAVSRDQLLNLLQSGLQPEAIWRAVTLDAIASIVHRQVPKDLPGRVSWVVNNPQDVREMIGAADSSLSQRDTKQVFIFDQLEQLADDYDQRRALTQGILRLALAYKSYRAIRVKVFMRPDQFSDNKLFDFADASKISGEAVTLDWRPHELYGLLFSRIKRSCNAAFARLCEDSNIYTTYIDPRTTLPVQLVQSEGPQHRVFSKLAGEFMGKNEKRGRPYTWLVLHLADALNQVSPRTFLRALKFAAEHALQTNPITVIDHEGIRDGVRYASMNRVEDLKEDYPWVPPALQALNRLLVPCNPEEILSRWQSEQIIWKLQKEVPLAKTPTWLSKAEHSEGRPLMQLLSGMATIGVIEQRLTTGKIDVPDIFRLPADIRRKGGVTPQQRRQIRIAKSQEAD